LPSGRYGSGFVVRQGGRNVVERFLNYLKQWRGLATRYDKYAHIYRGGVTLGAILCWLSSQR
jgi:transposase